MAYEKIGFNKGDVLKAEHLNHIENTLEELSPSPQEFLYAEGLASKDIDRIFQDPKKFSFSIDTYSSVSTSFSRKISENRLLYLGLNNAKISDNIDALAFTAITIDRDGTVNYSSTFLPQLTIIENLTFDVLQSFLHTIFFDPITFSFLMFRFQNDLVKFHSINLNQTDLFASELIFQSLYGDYKYSFLLDSESETFTVKQIFSESDSYTLSIDAINSQTLEEARSSILLGKKIELSIAPDYPGFKIPLVSFDEVSKKAWFSTELIQEEEDSIRSFTLLIAITIEGAVEIYIKNPATGELIPQE